MTGHALVQKVAAEYGVQVSDEDVGILLWEETSFPFAPGDIERTDVAAEAWFTKQLRDYFEGKALP